MLTRSEGGTKIWLSAREIGGDLIITITGGRELTAGIHLDNITKEEIAAVVKNSRIAEFITEKKEERI